MKSVDLPPQEILLQNLNYCPKTGHLFWKERGPDRFPSSFCPESSSRTWNAKKAGTRAFTWEAPGGYCRGKLNLKSYLAHRVIWKMVFGIDPLEIDHIDGDRKNNRIDNLRSVGRLDNMRNIALLPNNIAGCHGIRMTPNNKWEARIGRGRSLGVFDNLEKAIAIRKAAERELGYHPNHGRRG